LTNGCAGKYYIIGEKSVRNLTIKREKSFVGCLAKMKIYIEDAASGEICINNISYRKIGELKNGEEKIFSIDENECRVVVIVDKISKDYCNDFYKIPAGGDDIYLSGKNVFNPATGNAFRFNQVTDNNVFQNRKKGFKKGIIILGAFILIGFIAGIIIGSLSQNTSGKPKEFSKEGMTITLTNQFNEISQDGYTSCYNSRDVVIFVSKEEYSLMEGFDKYTLNEYGNLLITNNSLDSSVKLQNNDGLTYFEYQFSNPETNDLYHYSSFIFKTSDSFWLIQFATLEENYNDNKQTIINWAKNIEFSNS
jgi:hypothetical protein